MIFSFHYLASPILHFQHHIYMVHVSTLKLSELKVVVTLTNLNTVQVKLKVQDDLRVTSVCWIPGCDGFGEMVFNPR